MTSAVAPDVAGSDRRPLVLQPAVSADVLRGPVEDLATPANGPMPPASPTTAAVGFAPTAVQSEAPARVLRGATLRAAAAPAAAASLAAMDLPQLANAAVVDWFDSTSAWLATLPRGPLNEWASGALLLVRRSLFNQLPTADPYRYLTTLNGDLVGTLGVRDPEADALTYRLTTTPRYGTVQIAPNGRTVSGSATLRLANGAEYLFVVRGRIAGQAVVATLVGHPSDVAAKGIEISTTLTPLEGGWARLNAFSGKGYGQLLHW